ncbi:hypothetical protein [Rhizobium phage RHph_X2_28B]|nr:hypothetical protein PP751_gp007 [Rhizobium phage RHph_X2_28B]QWY83459.1 hypothetical protein [Rhizobium phage RHph_X2_28B]QWY83695.1 hypothetical protein [Rhizobium phage RHph_X3_15]
MEWENAFIESLIDEINEEYIENHFEEWAEEDLSNLQFELINEEDIIGDL